MAYWTLTYDYLDYIQFSWKDYYDERVWTLNSLYRHAEEKYREQGNYEIRNRLYTRDSIQRWYDSKVQDLKNWYNASMRELNEENDKFMRLYNQMCQDKYDSSVFHYEIIYDFYKFTRTVNYSSTLDNSHFRVKVSGQTHWYECSGRREEMEYKPENPSLKSYKKYI